MSAPAFVVLTSSNEREFFPEISSKIVCAIFLLIDNADICCAVFTERAGPLLNCIKLEANGYKFAFDDRNACKIRRMKTVIARRIDEPYFP